MSKILRGRFERHFWRHETFLKIPLVGETSFATFRVPLPSGGCKKRKRDEAATEKV
jgi:hypothetical protein